MATENNIKARSHVVVIGAGVVGLSTALRVQEKGYSVTILAEAFPSDPKSIRYTSHWAGAHHVSISAQDPLKRRMEFETFRVMWKMSAPGSDAEGCFLRLPQTEFFYDAPNNPYATDHLTDFRVVAQSELTTEPPAVEGVAFTTVTIDVPVYLNYLLARFLGRGGRIVRTALQHISQAAEGAFVTSPSPDSNSRPAAVIVCAGLGARTLGGVEDENVYPIRGQTVLVRAPWIRFGRTMSGNGEEAVWTYIIPRRSGDVILGGTKVNDDWYPHPREETTSDILARCLALCPELDPNYVSGSAPKDANAKQASMDALRALIIEEGCGLRPGRRGGVRLEKEVLTIPVGSGREERKVPMVYNYGHAGFGYQSSWGSASIAAELLEEVLKEIQ